MTTANNIKYNENHININIKGLERSQDKEAVEEAVADACRQVFDVAYERGYREAYNLAFEEGRRNRSEAFINVVKDVRALMVTGGSNGISEQH